MFEKVPEALKSLRQWVCWKQVAKKGDRPTKIPVRPDGSSASSTDARQWSAFGEAAAVADRYSGIGFVFSGEDPYCGIDFDACRDPGTGAIDEWAKDWIKKLDSYSEISPSKTGVKVWIKGKLPFESGKKVLLPQHKTGDKTPAIEAYDHARYFAVTGWRYDSLPHEPEDRQGILDALCAAFFSQESPPATADRGNRESSRLSVIERARRYLDTIPGAVSGSGGHDQTFKAACSLVLGFNLTKAEAFVLMSEYNNRCEPRWSERELRHKIESADRQPGDRGYLAKVNETDWNTVKVPDYREPEALKQAGTRRTGPTVITLKDSVDRYIKKISEDKTELLSTGIPLVDQAIGGGVDAHEMVLVCARPGHGKSAMALQALNAATYMGKPAAIVSEEMSALALGKRTLQFVTEIPEPLWLRQAATVKEDLTRHFGKREPCYVIEGCGSAERACEALRKLHDMKGVKVAAIDYAQLLTGTGRTRYEQITQTSISLRQLASSTGMTLYVLCQLNRAIEGREKFVPRLDDIKDSGQLEQDADVILFLVWPYRIDSNKNRELFEVWIGKNRNRPINAPEVDCRFNPARQMILHPRTVQNTEYPEKWNYGG